MVAAAGTIQLRARTFYPRAFSLCLVPPDEIEQMDRHSVKIMRFSLCISVDSGAMFGHIFPTKQRVLAAGMRKPHR